MTAAVSFVLLASTLPALAMVEFTVNASICGVPKIATRSVLAPVWVTLAVKSASNGTLRMMFSGAASELPAVFRVTVP